MERTSHLRCQLTSSIGTMPHNVKATSPIDGWVRSLRFTRGVVKRDGQRHWGAALRDKVKGVGRREIHSWTSAYARGRGSGNRLRRRQKPTQARGSAVRGNAGLSARALRARSTAHLRQRSIGQQRTQWLAPAFRTAPPLRRRCAVAAPAGSRRSAPRRHRRVPVAVPPRPSLRVLPQHDRCPPQGAAFGEAKHSTEGGRGFAKVLQEECRWGRMAGFVCAGRISP